MSTNSSRTKLRLNTLTVNLGCRCRRPKLSDVFHPKPKPRTTQPDTATYRYRSSSSSWGKRGGCSTDQDDTTTTTFSPNARTSSDCSEADYGGKRSRKVRGFGRIGGESMAVEKESDDPYLDFRQSMLQMILEKEIYAKEDLRELLNCFLQLNSPYYHGVIVRAFTEIWNGVFSVRSASPKLPAGHGCRKSRDF